MIGDAMPWTTAAIAAQARDRPDATAVVDDGGSMTFGELWALAGTVAEALDGFPGERVAIAAGRGRPFITAALGVWRAGRAYIPLDLMNPVARLRLITDDSRPAVVMVSPETAGIGAPLDVPELAVPTSTRSLKSFDLPSSDGDPVAYVMYTSGTTGRPKGVCVGHASLANLCRFMADEYGIGPADRALNVCSVGFDASAMEIWPTLAAGGAVVACSDTDRIRPEAAAALAAREHCTISVYPTGLAAAALATGHLPPLRFMFFGGDRMVLPAPPPASPRMVNVYGPTECTVIASTHVLTGGGAGDEPPIGRPIANVHLRLCDADSQPVGPGDVGELYIGGAAVAYGYLNRPDLTAQRFVSLPGVDGRWYRTGDLARWNPDGDLLFLGRAEADQLKVRGVRVEAGEIEAALVAHDQVRWAAVTVVDGGGTKEVVAVLVTDGDKPSDRSLRRHLMARLPASLMPDRYVAVDRLPLTPNGKLDRAEVTALAAATSGHT
jgi:amino acid adenylation domain-containing protein